MQTPGGPRLCGSWDGVVYLAGNCTEFTLAARNLCENCREIYRVLQAEALQQLMEAQPVRKQLSLFDLEGVDDEHRTESRDRQGEGEPE